MLNASQEIFTAYISWNPLMRSGDLWHLKVKLSFRLEASILCIATRPENGSWFFAIFSIKNSNSLAPILVDPLAFIFDEKNNLLKFALFLVSPNNKKFKKMKAKERYEKPPVKPSAKPVGRPILSLNIAIHRFCNKNKRNIRSFRE